MKKYDISDDFKERTHLIKLTFQYDEYKGYITYEVCGNNTGLNVLNQIYGDFGVINPIENDCGFDYDEDAYEWRLVLKNKKGESITLYINNEMIDNYVVAVEIVECRLEN